MTEQSTMEFPHLILNLYDCGESAIDDEGYIAELIIDLSSLIGMNIISGPHLLSYGDPNSKDHGVTGYAIIAESHIAVHTYTFDRCTYLDIFSCKDFDVEKAILFITDRLESKRCYKQLIHRRTDAVMQHR